MAVEKNKDADITAQTKPNQITARFHKIILSWDYFRLLSESQKISKDKGKIAALGLKKVKDTYKDIDDYIGTFEPLLFEEVKAHITQEKDEEEVRVWKQGVVMQCSEADGFHFPLVGHNHEDGISLAENDLVLLSNKELKEGSDLSSTTYAFALVLNREGNSQLKLCMFLAGEVQQMDVGNLKSSPRLLKMHSVVTTSEQRIVWMLKIANLSTIVREYLGLWSISSLPFKELILSASEKDANSKDQAWKIPRLLMEFLESNHNPSQLGAIRVGLSRKTFVLIQGPPGTGKTQTILGLLSAILHSTPARVQSKGQWCDQRRGPKLDTLDMYNHWKLASPWLHDTNPRDSIMPIDGDDGFFPTSGNELKPEVVQSNRKYRVRVLVCAPSNSALDEIVLRVLSTGIRDEGDRAYNPKIVRIGLKAHHSVKAVSLDYLVEQKLCGSANTADARKNGVAGGDRDSIRASVLDEAAIVFSTLSFSGSALFAKLKHAFDVVIIDEAAQAVEPATLIPLTNGCKQVFLVGDPVQLPATVISDVAKNFGYGTSLFKRLQGAGYPVQMLKTQYRMHPEIRHFPSREFYADSLEDGPDVKDQTERPWHNYRCFRPFCFFDIEDGVESRPSGSGSSWVNHDEVDFVLLMYQTLVTRHSELKSSSRIAIISPYAHQVKRFRHKFRENFGVDSDKLIDINTVDGFQGREKDVAIFSCVRANKGKGIGFVDDKRRMNVGITRARSSVLVVGSASTLKQDEHWRSLLESAEERNCLFKVSKPYKDFFSDGNLKTMYEPKEEAMEEVQDEGPGPGVIYNGDADGDGDGDGDADGGYAEDGDAYGDGGGYDED